MGINSSQNYLLTILKTMPISPGLVFILFLSIQKRSVSPEATKRKVSLPWLKQNLKKSREKAIRQQVFESFSKRKEKIKPNAHNLVNSSYTTQDYHSMDVINYLIIALVHKRRRFKNPQTQSRKFRVKAISQLTTRSQLTNYRLS